LNLTALCLHLVFLRTPLSTTHLSFRVAKVYILTTLPNIFLKKKIYWKSLQFEELTHFFETDCKDTSVIICNKFYFKNLFILTCNFFFFNELYAFLKRAAKIGWFNFSPNFFRYFLFFFTPSTLKEPCFFVKRAAKISVD